MHFKTTEFCFAESFSQQNYERETDVIFIVIKV